MKNDRQNTMISEFRERARQLEVVSFACNGEYGVFEGAIDDEVVHGTYLREGIWAPAMLDLLVHGLFAQGSGTLIDIGANIGLVSIPVVEKSGVACLAFEPEPFNFTLLKHNILAHGLESKIAANNVALYSEKGQIQLQRDPSNSGDNRLIRDTNATKAANRETRTITVDADRLDALIDPERLAHPVVVKMDTQGAEVRVLEGARQILPHVDYLISEYWPRGLWLMGDTPQRFQNLVDDFAYGAILDQTDSTVNLNNAEEMFQRLSWIPADGSDDGFFDVILAKHPTLQFI